MNWPWSHNKHRKEEKEIIFVEQTDIIIVEDCHYKKFNPEKEELHIIEELIKANEKLSKIIDKLTTPIHLKPIFTLSTLNNQFIMADVSLVVGTPQAGVFTLLDNKTGSPIAASFSNQALGTNSNPEFATFELDASNPSQVNANGVAAGSGTIVISTHADYTDAGDGSAQSADFSVTKNFTVTVVTTPDGVSFDVAFS